MKTLAAVTAAFLPATFMASFFAMPLINWDAEKNNLILKERFWIRGVVTVPLTLTTLVIWLSWTHRQTLLLRTQGKKDRERLLFDMSGREKVEGEGEDGCLESRASA